MEIMQIAYAVPIKDIPKRRPLTASFFICGEETNVIELSSFRNNKLVTNL